MHVLNWIHRYAVAPSLSESTKHTIHRTHIRINRVSHKGHTILFASTTNAFFLACFRMQPKHSYDNRLRMQKPKRQTWMNEFYYVGRGGTVWWSSAEMRFCSFFFLIRFCFKSTQLTISTIFFGIFPFCIVSWCWYGGHRKTVQLVGRESNSNVPYSRAWKYIGSYSFTFMCN